MPAASDEGQAQQLEFEYKANQTEPENLPAGSEVANIETIEDATLVADVGTELATITGGGDNTQIITYSMGGAGGGGSPVQSGRLVTFAGSDGDGGSRWNYGAPPNGNPGREAWMTGGGDDTQVVYVSPR